MAKTNYYLRPGANSDGEQVINLFLSYAGKKMQYPTGQSIKPVDWNPNEQRAKRSFNGYKTLNGYLDKLESSLKDVYNIAVTANMNPITFEYIRNEMNKIYYPEQVVTIKEKGFEDYVTEYLNNKAVVLTHETVQKYALIFDKLRACNKEYKLPPLSLESFMNETLYYKFLEYEGRMRMNQITVGKEVTQVKTFLHWCLAKKYTTDASFMAIWKSFSRAIEVISLKEEELFHLMSFDFSPERNWTEILSGMLDYDGKQISYSETWSSIRDIFAFSCMTALRYSDYFQLLPIHINRKTKELLLTTVKTDEIALIPLNDYAMEILERYNFDLPKYSNPYVNRELKNIARIAGLNEKKELVSYIGKERITETFEKWELITHHIARKTCITLCLAKGMRHETVMKISQHKKLATLQKYITVDKEIVRTEMEKAWKIEGYQKYKKKADRFDIAS